MMLYDLARTGASRQRLAGRSGIESLHLRFATSGSHLQAYQSNNMLVANSAYHSNDVALQAMLEHLDLVGARLEWGIVLASFVI